MVGIPESQKLEFAPVVSLHIGIEKKCSKCGEMNDFYSLNSNICKECVKKTVKLYQKNNPEKTKAMKRKCYLVNIEITKERAVKWNKEHPDAHRMATNKWRRKNPDLVKLQNKRADTKEYSTPKGKLNCCMSAGIYASLAGTKNGRKWAILVGYTVDILKKHLEGLFQDGMSWDNYGEWHVDHKIPLTAFNFENAEDLDFRKAWSLKNLQPMWALENMKKGTKISKSFQPSLLIEV